MDTCRVTSPDDFPPISSPTLFVTKTGEATFIPGGKVPPKYKIAEILAMGKDIKKGKITVFFTWVGQWRHDIFKLRPEDTDIYMQRLQERL